MNNLRGNKGSATIEVTLWMPVILLVTVLMITLLLSVLQQSQLHSVLVVGSIIPEISKETTAMPDSVMNDMEELEGDRTKYIVTKDGEDVIYTAQSKLTLAGDYQLTESVEQRLRITNIEKDMRRWQMLGSAISK